MDPKLLEILVCPLCKGPLAWKKEFVMWSMRNDSLVKVRADVVFVGYGIVAPEVGWNDYEGLDAKGKIVVVLVNDPGMQDSTIFRGKILTYYGRWTYKIEEARRQGAAGILIVHTTETATYPWTTVLSGWVGPQVRLEGPPSSLIVAGWLHQDAAARLFRQGGQDLAALTAAAARRGFRPVPLTAADAAAFLDGMLPSSESQPKCRFRSRPRVGPVALAWYWSRMNLMTCQCRSVNSSMPSCLASSTAIASVHWFGSC